VSEPILHLTSPLAEGINQFLAYRRALGRRYDNEAWSLRLLDRYLAAHGIECIGDITPPVIEAFLVSRPRPRARSYNLLLGIVRNLFCWMAARQMIDSSPVQARRRRETDVRIPCLFQVDQARRLLFLAEGLPDGRGTRLRGLTYRMVFGVLYGLGLRAGEVLHLCVGDVDRDRRLLVIRETKFRKSRLVPFGPVMAMHLERYLELRRELVPGLLATDPLFSLQANGPIGRTTLGRTFHALAQQIELDARPGTASPRVHGLRHSFAVGTLLRWYREGLDPNQRLLHLSTFLGHVQPESTAAYLTITEELLAEAATRFEHYAQTGTKGVAP